MNTSAIDLDINHACSKVKNYIACEDNGDLTQIFLDKTAPLQIMNKKNGVFTYFTLISLEKVQDVAGYVLFGKFYIALHAEEECVSICVVGKREYAEAVLHAIKCIVYKN